MENENEELIDNELIFDSSHVRRNIHPAIDIVDGVFYFGFQLPYRTADDAIQEGLCFINSRRECFLAKDENLARRRLKLKYPAVVKELRWQLEDIYDFLHSRNNNPHPRTYSDLPFKIATLLKKYIDFYYEKTYLLVSLWIIGTYLQPIWYSYPYLSITGVKRCGKSKLLKFIEMLGFNAIFSTSISTPALYRIVQNLRPTLLVDEAEKYASAEKQDEIRNILNSGYKKYGKVFRASKTRGEKIIIESFEVFSPKAFVTYKGLEDVTEDRCIPIVMIRSNNKDVINSEIYEDDPCWASLRNLLYRFALEKYHEIDELYRTINVQIQHEAFSSREHELWKPILTLAKYFNVLKNVEPLVVETVEKKTQADLESPELLLLKALAELVTEDGYYTVADIKGKLITYFDEVPKWLTSHWIGATLSRQFNLTEKTRLGKNRARAWYLSRDIIKNLCARYLVPYTLSENNSENNIELENKKENIKEAKLDEFDEV